MPDIFGLDLAGIVNDAFDSAPLVPLSLTIHTAGTRTSGELTGGTNPTSTTHTGQGVLVRKEVLDQGARRLGTFLTVLGASIQPAAVPKAGDQVTIEGATYTLARLVSRDPAAAAYKFEVSA